MHRIFAVALAALVLAAVIPAAASAVTIQEFPLAPGAAPFYLKPGPDGNLWVVDKAGTGAIRRVSMAGAALTPVPATSPQDIAVGPSGNVYWTETGLGNGGAGAVVRLTTDGLRTTQQVPGLFAYAIVVGPNERVVASGRLQGGRTRTPRERASLASARSRAVTARTSGSCRGSPRSSTRRTAGCGGC